MGLSQALSAALAGVNATQQALSVISGNVANANTAGYVDESISQLAVATAGQPGVSVDTTGINRNLNSLLQSQLWTESSGGSYADTTSQLYQQLQQVYGTPGLSSSFAGIFSNFTSAVQALSTSPSSYSAQTQVLTAAQALTQNLGAMTSTVQELRTQAEQGIATDVQTANTAIAQIAQINQQLGSAPQDSATATLEDQRDQDISQLATLMNVTVAPAANNQISVYTGQGQQLVSGVQASTLSFGNAGTLNATTCGAPIPARTRSGRSR
jgi:flagellar hook-associated protein 1